MSLLPIVVLALVQGLTEFLPISSSGHLVVVHTLLGESRVSQSRLIFDVAVHVGTLLAVLVYFRRDALAMLGGLKNMVTKKDFTGKGAKLNIHVLAASIPVLLAGLVLHALHPSWLGMIEIMAWTSLLFGILLWIADRTPEHGKGLDEMTLREAILIGLAQAVALIPGTSRAGITMTAARFLGYSRTESAHFSLLLAIIAISGAGILEGAALFNSMDAGLGLDVAVGILVAFISGWASIALMMRFLEKYGFAPFAIYRILGGILILGLIYGGVWTPS